MNNCHGKTRTHTDICWVAFPGRIWLFCVFRCGSVVKKKESKLANIVVIGTQWGDEGKGKVVDLLAEHADLVVRFQGGANAGHTLLVDGQELVTHLVPSGVMHPAKRCAIGPGVVVDPEILVEEIDALQARGLLADPGVLTRIVNWLF